MLQKENLSDIIRLLAGFLLSLKLLFNSFGVNFITNDQIDAIVNVAFFSSYILVLNSPHLTL